jgi:hypothetical protein
MSLPYIGPVNTSNYQSVKLKDFKSNCFGQLYLCNRQDIALPSGLPPLSGPGYPGPNPAPVSFAEVFTSLANQIGQQLSVMNEALLNLHMAWGTNRQIDGQNLNRYLAAARAMLITLGLIEANNSNKAHRYWPLVPMNDGKKRLPLQAQLANTLEVANDGFPGKPHGAPPKSPKHNQALYFTAPVLQDGTDAVGSIVFYQDCEWNPGTALDTEWSSWGFVTYFALTLFETLPSISPPAEQTQSISSSSSEYYAASSSLPGIRCPPEI